ncbi:MAG: hypothetical protein AB7R55_05470 [Gemmatimonadales bacterium]
MLRTFVTILVALGLPALSAAAQTVDSILPIEEQVRRFRATVAEHPTRLRGAPSRSALVLRFVEALERRDTLALASLLLDKAEFAYLYYPWTPYTRPPYRQDPALVWFRMSAISERGLTRLLARDAGTPLGVTGHRCDPEPNRMGPNRVWTNCVVTIARTRPRQLFGSIIERDGRFKFLTYDTEY